MSSSADQETPIWLGIHERKNQLNKALHKEFPIAALLENPVSLEIKKMEKQQIFEIVQKAISKLKDKDPFLLKNDISERAISHKLGVYLNDKFPTYTVDCEYNGYARADNDKKYIKILRGRITELGKLKDSDNDEDLLKRLVYPDIIVHQRGLNENLLIIEIKKKKNADIEFDREKLLRYTSPEYGNNLKYSLGALITFTTGENEMKHDIEWYERGQQITI